MIQPTRIRLARQRQGLTRAALAGAVGVTARTLTTWERDGAPDARSTDLSVATGQPASFFARPALPEVTDDAAFFRARRRTGARLRHRALSLGVLGTDFYRGVTALFHLPPLRLRASDSRLSPRQAAHELRAAWGLGAGPLPNLVQLCESRGIRVLGLPMEALEVDAFSFWAEDGYPYILLSRIKTAERSRFDLAHEIGHLVMHGSALSTDDRTDRELEREADTFAAELLMPRATVRADVAQAPSLRGLLAFKSSFGVSAQAAARAVHDAGSLSEWGYRQLLSELAQRGFDDGEPGSVLRYERSRVIQALVAHLRATRTPVSAWARSIGQRPQDAAAFMLGQGLMAVPGALDDADGTVALGVIRQAGGSDVAETPAPAHLHLVP